MPPIGPSFTDEVKGELAQLHPAKTCCQHAELWAIVGALGGQPDRPAISLRILRNPLARKVVQLAKATGGTVQRLSRGSGGRRPDFRLDLTLGPALSSRAVCCARASLRGAFLARGAVGSPGQGYHLEVALPPTQDAAMTDVLHRLRVPVHRLARRGRTIFYLKGAEEISRILGLIGANRAVMRLENDRVLREMRGQANRRVNSETANLDKRLRVARRQVEHIRVFKQHDPGLHSLPAVLRRTAELRLAHPHARLETLAHLDHVSKSGMAHRLRRLEDWAARNGLVDSAIGK